MGDVEIFCRILRDRSSEHRKSFQLLYPEQLYGQAMSILRQELDSFIRVIYLLNISDFNTRSHFISQTLNIEKWRNPVSNAIITDRDMVNITNQLYGWTSSVYKLGCAFIHLSPLLDYKNSNPFENIPVNEQFNIEQHLHQYHNYSLDQFLSMNSVSPYLMQVFEKISSNLLYYIDCLENNDTSCL